MARRTANSFLVAYSQPIHQLLVVTQAKRAQLRALVPITNNYVDLLEVKLTGGFAVSGEEDTPFIVAHQFEELTQLTEDEEEDRLIDAGHRVGACKFIALRQIDQHLGKRRLRHHFHLCSRNNRLVAN